MVVEFCVHCGKEVDTEAKTCSHCGFNVSRKKTNYFVLGSILISILFVLIYFFGKSNSDPSAQHASQANIASAIKNDDGQSPPLIAAKAILSNDEFNTLGVKMRKYADSNVIALATRFKGNMSLVAYELASQIKSEFGIDKVNQWDLAYKAKADSEKKACLQKFPNDSNGECARIGQESFEDIVWHPIYDACQKYLANADVSGSNGQVNQNSQSNDESAKPVPSLTQHDKCIHHAGFVQSVITRRDAGMSPEDSLHTLPLYQTDGKLNDIQRQNVTKYMINLVYFDGFFRGMHGRVFDALYLACMDNKEKQFEPLKYGEE